MTEPARTSAKNAVPHDFWDQLRPATQARIGLGRSGDAAPTPALLEFRAAHAMARDAVHTPLAVEALTVAVSAVGLGEPVRVRSRAVDRSQYLRRPDLGREPDLGAGQGFSALAP
ncbi:ethanolamine ammonia-lyase light chain EutC, partial [Nocardia gipuzkoensis]